MFLVQSTVVGDDIEDTMAPPHATMLEEFVESGKCPILFLLNLDGKPPFRPIYRLSYLQLQEAILFVKKKDKALQMVVDYCA